VTLSRGNTLPGYLGLVVVPVLIAVSLATWQWLEYSEALSFDRYQRAAQGSVHLLTQAMGRSQADLAARAPIVPVAPPYAPAIRRALAGDTVAGLASTSTSLELTVVVADSAGVVRMIREPFHPRFLSVLPGLTDLGVSIYLRGHRSATTDPPLGPTALVGSTVAALAAGGTGVRYEEAGVRGMFGVVSARAGTEPELVLLVGEAGGAARGRWLLTLLPILGIVLFLALTAAWTMQRAASSSLQKASFAQSAMVALIPVLAGAAILMAFDRGFRTEVVDSGTLELSQSMLLMRQLDHPLSPDLIKQATGFDVAIVGPSGVEGTTVAGVDLIDALSKLRLPPPNWMSSGVAATNSGPAFYEMVRVGPDRGLVLLRTDLRERATSLRRMLLQISAVMVLPSGLFLAFGGRRRRNTIDPVRPSSP
jgi:hypothetical protein